MPSHVLGFDRLEMSEPKTKNGRSPSNPYGHAQQFLESLSSPELPFCVGDEDIKRRRRVFVSDIETDMLLKDTPAQSVLREAGIRAVQSTPIISRKGRLLGVLTTQWGIPHASNEHELWRLDLLIGQAADLIDQARAAEALSRSEERFRALVTATSDVVYHMSPDWSEMRFLQGRDFLTDTNAPERTWLGKYILQEDRPRVMAAINEASRNKRNSELEHRVLRIDGTVGWTVSRAVPLMNDKGKIVEWFGAASDISERKRAESQLAADLDAMTRLHALGALFVREGNLEPVFDEIVKTAVAISRADFGNIEMLKGKSGTQRIAAQCGFPLWWFDSWDKADAGRGACGKALERGERVIVTGITQSPLFRGKPELAMQLSAGVRAVQSTPLSSGSIDTFIKQIRQTARDVFDTLSKSSFARPTHIAVA